MRKGEHMGVGMVCMLRVHAPPEAAQRDEVRRERGVCEESLQGGLSIARPIGLAERGGE